MDHHDHYPNNTPHPLLPHWTKTGETWTRTDGLRASLMPLSAGAAPTVWLNRGESIATGWPMTVLWEPPRSVTKVLREVDEQEAMEQPKAPSPSPTSRDPDLMTEEELLAAFEAMPLSARQEAMKRALDEEMGPVATLNWSKIPNAEIERLKALPPRDPVDDLTHPAHLRTPEEVARWRAWARAGFKPNPPPWAPHYTADPDSGAFRRGPTLGLSLAPSTDIPTRTIIRSKPLTSSGTEKYFTLMDNPRPPDPPSMSIPLLDTSPWPPLSREQVVQLHEGLVAWRRAESRVGTHTRASYNARNPQNVDDQLFNLLVDLGIGSPPPKRTWTHEEVARAADKIQMAQEEGFVPKPPPAAEPQKRNCWSCSHNQGLSNYCDRLRERLIGTKVRDWIQATPLSALGEDPENMPSKDSDNCPGWEPKPVTTSSPQPSALTEIQPPELREQLEFWVQSITGWGRADDPRGVLEMASEDLLEVLQSIGFTTATWP